MVGMNKNNNSAAAASNEAAAVVPSTPIKKANNFKQKPAKVAPVAKVVSAYKVNVLDVNAALKVERATLGHCLTLLVQTAKTINLPVSFLSAIKAVQKDSAKYKALSANVRTTKTGKFTPFYVLQYLHKNA